jgi:hypothetical protein
MGRACGSGACRLRSLLLTATAPDAKPPPEGKGRRLLHATLGPQLVQAGGLAAEFALHQFKLAPKLTRVLFEDGIGGALGGRSVRRRGGCGR